MSRETAPPGAERPLRLFLVAGEHSGDALGAKLMAALKTQAPTGVTFAGVGGAGMAHEGLASLFPLDEVAVMGPVAILQRLPSLVRRVHQTVDAAVAWNPDAVVIIDSPEFTHPIAKRIAKRLPGVPVIDYVSPSVWAWRPGRAKKMRRYIDHVLCLLPFEPEVHQRLQGPPATYVGHPLIERLDWIRGLDPSELAGRLGLMPGRPVLIVLPGSRASEVGRLMQPFGAAIAGLVARIGPVEILIPTVPSVRALVEDGVGQWPAQAGCAQIAPERFLLDETDKFKAFRLARAALAASGTVTLELALAGTPMVVAYKVEPLATVLRFMLNTSSIVLANLVLGRNAFPELIQENCTGDKLGAALCQVMVEGSSVRAEQLAGLAEIGARMRLANGQAPSAAAAGVVMTHAAGQSRAGPRV